MLKLNFEPPFVFLKLKQVRPSIGWQIDPFGHSLTQAKLLTAEAGLKATYFGRIDYEDLKQRQTNKEAEFVWQGCFSCRNYNRENSSLCVC